MVMMGYRVRLGMSFQLNIYSVHVSGITNLINVDYELFCLYRKRQ